MDPDRLRIAHYKRRVLHGLCLGRRACRGGADSKPDARWGSTNRRRHSRAVAEYGRMRQEARPLEVPAEPHCYPDCDACPYDCTDTDGNPCPDCDGRTDPYPDGYPGTSD